VLEAPLGAWMVMIAGVWMIGAGLGEAFKGLSTAFARDFDYRSIGPVERWWARWLGRIGLISRAVVFVMVGLFLVEAGFESNPGEARGIGGALEELITEPQGPMILSGIAIGLIIFGIFSALSARWVRISRCSPGAAHPAQRPAEHPAKQGVGRLSHSQPAA
ncbi:MAG TPA: DUF1206 domain-containing protein, partial [Chloroflexota bacterium]|nr:DUF1206 domain-containing protein [Chloroflexota bacterium]